MSLRILLVGSGGREHALAWKLVQSPSVAQIYAVPGNGGTALLEPKVHNVADVSATNFSELLKFATDNDINLLVPGPEDPLVNGIVDYFREHGPARIAIFGPTKAAARLEGEKAYAKDFMQRHSIPTAEFETFTSFDAAKAYIESKPSEYRVVIKANGLAAGKGVKLPETHEEAVKEVSSILMGGEFGSAGNEVVIEQYLIGQELSVLSFCDGHTVRSLPAAQDHKQIYDGDKGPNTGGMGCYAPTPIATADMMEQIHREAIQPTIDGIRRESAAFVGCLFTGFMLTNEGPKVLEYNVRFGDPECQTVLPLLETDLADVIMRCAHHRLDSIDLKVKSSFSTTVVAAAEGYPDSYKKGTPMQLSPAPEGGLTDYGPSF